MHTHTAFIATAAFLMGFLSVSNAHSNGLDASTCANFNVVHGSYPEDQSHIVTLELLENGSATDCFHTLRNYQVRLSTNTGVIKGFILKAGSGAKLPAIKKNLPGHTTWGPCTNTVSHTQARSTRSDDLIFTLKTKRSTAPLVFKYSVVFSMSEYQQGRIVRFPYCSNTEGSGSGVTNTNTTETNDTTAANNASAATDSTNTTEVTPNRTLVENSYHCGKEVLYITKSRNNYTHTNGIRYNCIIKNPLKQTTCTEFCEYNSRPITCEVMNHTDKRKKYICSAIEDGQDLSGISQSQHTFEQRFDEVVTSSCHCFYL